MKTLCLPLLAAVLWMTDHAASAQNYNNNYYHSSTAAGDAAQGLASVVSAAGSYNLQTSEAAQNYAAARSQEIQNRLQATNTYFEMRRVNTAARAAEQGPRPSAEAYARMAKMGAPDRLSSSQLDRVTGVINWPMLLQDPRFADDVKPLEELFHKRVNNAHVSYDEYQDIKKDCDALLQTLLANINNVDSTDYIHSKVFLQNLAYEAKFPTS